MAVLLWLGVLGTSLPARADEVWAAAEAQALWTHDEWRRLLHYKPGLWADRWRSDADDPRFFLAEDGATNPRAELAATLAAFAAPAMSRG